MVDNILSLSNRGLRDWLIQRVTAVILAVYFLFMMGFLIFHPQLQFDEWQMLFSYNITKILSFLTLLCIVLHAWIGMWTVFTDYITSISIRLCLQVLAVILYFCCLAWGLTVLWGI
jgi:succinate dehydrogenase / fumarate reductase membrane anchor subunit